MSTKPLVPATWGQLIFHPKAFRRAVNVDGSPLPAMCCTKVLTSEPAAGWLHPSLSTFSFSGSESRAWSCLLISAMVRGPFLSAREEKPWLDNRSSKSFSDTLGFGPAGEQRVRGTQTACPPLRAMQGLKYSSDRGTAEMGNSQRSCLNCGSTTAGSVVAGVRTPPPPRRVLQSGLARPLLPGQRDREGSWTGWHGRLKCLPGAEVTQTLI